MPACARRRVRTLASARRGASLRAKDQMVIDVAERFGVSCREMKLRVSRWSFSAKPVTPNTLREHYQPPSYRVEEHRLPARVEFMGRARAAIWLIIVGDCEVTAGDQVVKAIPGDLIELPDGDYTIRVSPKGELHAVQVWDLRQFMN